MLLRKIEGTIQLRPACLGLKRGGTYTESEDS